MTSDIAQKQREKPKTEKVKRCQWPTKCVVEATLNVIDFGFNPPAVRELCRNHAEAYMKLERNYAIKEQLKP